MTDHILVAPSVNTVRRHKRSSLVDLAVRIEVEHAAVGSALQSALSHAIKAGELLIEAKRKVGHGQWLPWLANSTVPVRTASHYMRLAKRRSDFCDQNGNVLPISVTDAMESLKHYVDRGGINGSERFHCVEERWKGLPWGKFVDALQAVTQLMRLGPPTPRHIAKAARAGKTPGLTAAALREAIALLTHYAEALDDDR